MTTSTPCARCGTPRTAGAAEACPGCLLLRAAASPEPAPEPPRPGEKFGGHQILERIASGGMGVVYRARKDDSGEVVALKMLRGGELADEGDQVRFRREAQAVPRHPNIVPILEVGELFFTMPLMAGSLADQLSEVRRDRARAGALLASVARAVHHAHQHGLLHRDLKPANLLLDASGGAHVADFGIAKRLDQSTELTQTGAVMGTPAYMAPEQALGGARDVTVAADVYSLGAILYELLTGRPPFAAETRERLLRQVQDEEPKRPRTLDPTIARDLETVCLKCLEKLPERRYPSALALADELELALRGERIATRSVGQVERVWRWTRRHPILLGLGVFLLLFGSSSAGVVIFETTAQRNTLHGDVLAANVFAARAVADGVAFELRDHGQRVLRAANAPGVRELLERDAGFDPRLLLAGVDAPGDRAAFDNWEVLDPDGAVLARWPAAPAQLGRQFAWRDYFRGAAELKDGVYVSRALESVVDRRIKFSLSAPIRGGNGRLLGVMSGMLATDSTLGALHFDDPNDASRTAALISPRDRDQPDGGLPERWVVVVHDGLTRGQPVAIDSPAARQQSQSSANHRDPVPGYDDGRWLAGFAPVPGSGLVVIVQTREVEREGTATVLLEVGGLLAGCALLGLTIGWLGRRRRR